jgi:DNA (cytosine-5)-methyltransferase 1
MCRIQTFPDGLKFGCGRTDVQKMLGNAVPSLLTEILAREIRRQFFGHRAALRPLRLLPPVRSPVPSPERVARLPAKYRHLIGDHADHPGEGRLKAKKVRETNLLEALQLSLLAVSNRD